jgi:hypothetical protein
MGTLAREYLKKMHNFDVNAEIEPIVQGAVDHTNQTGKPAVKETPKAGNVVESAPRSKYYKKILSDIADYLSNSFEHDEQTSAVGFLSGESLASEKQASAIIKGWVALGPKKQMSLSSKENDHFDWIDGIMRKHYGESKVTESSITVDMMNGIKKQIDAANKERAKHGDDELTTIIWSKRNNVASVSPDFGSTEFDLDIEDKRTAEKIAASLRMNFEIKE